MSSLPLTSRKWNKNLESLLKGRYVRKLRSDADQQSPYYLLEFIKKLYHSCQEGMNFHEQNQKLPVHWY